MSQATLDELVAEAAWMRRLARSLFHDDAAADDLAQDTCVIAAEKAPRDGRPIRDHRNARPTARAALIRSPHAVPVGSGTPRRRMR